MSERGRKERGGSSTYQWRRGQDLADAILDGLGPYMAVCLACRVVGAGYGMQQRPEAYQDYEESYHAPRVRTSCGRRNLRLGILVWEFLIHGDALHRLFSKLLIICLDRWWY